MPNKLSAMRHIRADKRKRDRNVSMRSATKTALKKAEQAIQEGRSDAVDLVRAAISMLDKAAQRGAISRGRANRKKSSLTKKLSQIEAA